jgi:hypothetical protein
MAGGGHRYSASQKEYEAAMLEWDSKKLMERVNTAEAILSSRLQILKQGQEGHPESEAIEDALRIFDFFSASSYTIRADRKMLQFGMNTSPLRCHWPLSLVFVTPRTVVA